MPQPAETVPQARIRVLPPEVADKIAAGEVVERPASVVKELVENSIDAGAGLIRVELEDAGIGLISVSDDGEGMSSEDAVTAVQRHATSKVRDIDDLFHITTLGFRGEALASIAAVSTLTLVTRRSEDLSGTQILVRGSHLEDVRSVGTAAGTRIDVADLFGNVPARRKFLKAPATEVGHVSELITRTALAWPRVGFSLKHGNRKLFEYPPVQDPYERVLQVFGKERGAALLAFQGHSPIGAIRGWLTGSHYSLPTPRQIFTYVNGRYVRDKLVSHALVAGYSTLLMHGRYPAAAVFLDVAPEEVDVNVHPAKSEVRFRRGGAVHDLITRTVMERLRQQGSDPAAPIHAEAAEAAPAALQGGTGSGSADQASLHLPIGLRSLIGDAPLRLIPLPSTNQAAPLSASREAHAAADNAPEGEAPHASPLPSAWHPQPVRAATIASGFFAHLRVIGQAFEGYVICESGSLLVIIDQHAAHERVTFERLRRAYTGGGVNRQRLLIPIVVDVGAQAAPLLEERLTELEGLGFELETYGGSSFAVRAVPALLSDTDPTELVRDLAEELTDVGRSRRLHQAAESVLARLACHNAVRVGQSLGAEQIRALLAAMDGVDFAGNCPHGRPAYITLPRTDLERLFKRT